MGALIPHSDDGDAVRRAIEEANQLLNARAEAFKRYYREVEPDARDAAHKACKFAERRIGVFLGELKKVGLLGDGRPGKGTKIGQQKSPVTLPGLALEVNSPNHPLRHRRWFARR
jgi:hypothetical protein